MFVTLDPTRFTLAAGYFPHEATCLCDFCLPQNTCQHFHGGDCEHNYYPEPELQDEPDGPDFCWEHGAECPADSLHSLYDMEPELCPICDGYCELFGSMWRCQDCGMTGVTSNAEDGA